MRGFNRFQEEVHFEGGGQDVARATLGTVDTARERKPPHRMMVCVVENGKTRTFEREGHLKTTRVLFLCGVEVRRGLDEHFESQWQGRHDDSASRRGVLREIRGVGFIHELEIFRIGHVNNASNHVFH